MFRNNRVLEERIVENRVESGRSFGHNYGYGPEYLENDVGRLEVGGANFMGGSFGRPLVGPLTNCGIGGKFSDCDLTIGVPSSLDGFLSSHLEDVSICQGERLIDNLRQDGHLLYAASTNLNMDGNNLAVRSQMVDGISDYINDFGCNGVVSDLSCDTQFISENLALLGNIICNLTPILTKIGYGASHLGDTINVIDNTSNNAILRELMQCYGNNAPGIGYNLKSLATNIDQLGERLSTTGFSLSDAAQTFVNFGQDLSRVACVINDLGVTELGSCYGGDGICVC